MRRIILTALALMMFGGVASADRQRGRRDTSRHSGGTVVRDHRQRQAPVHTERRDHQRNTHRNTYRDDHRTRVNRHPVYANNGHYVFDGGVSRPHHRPVIRHRYYDHQHRPQIIVENYDPVPGYVWVQGSWNWNGYEWIWTSGYWVPDPNYSSGYYDSSGYDSGYYDSSGHDSGYYSPGVSGGVTIQGGIRF